MMSPEERQRIETALRDFRPAGVTTHAEHLRHLHRVMVKVLCDPNAPDEMVALAEAYLTAYPE